MSFCLIDLCILHRINLQLLLLHHGKTRLVTNVKINTFYLNIDDPIKLLSRMLNNPGYLINW